MADPANPPRRSEITQTPTNMKPPNPTETREGEKLACSHPTPNIMLIKH